MSYPQAIVISSAIFAGAFLITGMGQSQPAPPGPRYQIAATPGRSVANVWRINVVSGEIYRCFATGGRYSGLCRKARIVDSTTGASDEDSGPAPESARLRGERKTAFSWE
ncbi:MAG: hypothetical protein O2807_03770 [bacterium]|nr:hypothetical protein [bacterium]